MTDYTKTTDFEAKDSLPSGDTNKVIRGSEFEVEFDNIATAIATKANKASPTFTGTATIPTASVTTLNLGGVAVTSTAAELNLLDGVTATTAEINYLDGVTSNIQTQIDGLGTGDGSVTNVAMTVPTGLSVAGTPITTSGTLAVTYAAGYAIPTTAKQTQWDTAYSWGNHASGGYAPTASPTFTGTATIPTASVTTLNLGGVAVTSTAAELNILDGVTATAAEINKLDGVTATTAELNKLDGVTATTAELNYVDGVTSNIQTQLNTKLEESDFTESLTSNGWTKLPNGLIIQWGRTSIAGNTAKASVSFPTTFDNACLSVVITGEDSDVSRGDNVSLGTTSPTTSTFRITNGVNTTLFFRFIAVGY